VGRQLRRQGLGTPVALHRADPARASPLPFCLHLRSGTDFPSQIDYRSFLGKMWEAMPAAEFVAMASDPAVLGNPLLMTQHFIGGSRWEKVSETQVVGYHQLRVPHQRYVDETRAEVAVKGHAHSHNTHWYTKVDGVWKFAGLCPDIRWGEYDFDRVFAEGREEFAEGEKKDEDVVMANEAAAANGIPAREVEVEVPAMMVDPVIPLTPLTPVAAVMG
jgi:scytalone dehydratase